MDAGGVLDAENLDRLREKCADLSGELTDGQLLAWAEASAPADVPDVIFGLLADAGLLTDSDPLGRTLTRTRRQRPKPELPAEADELWSRIWEVDEPTAIDLLVSLVTGNLRDRSRRARRIHRYQDDPQDIFAEMASLIGPGARWWTNTDLTEWNPVTSHMFDAMVVGAGNGMVVTLIAFDTA